MLSYSQGYLQGFLSGGNFALANGVSASDITRHALERYAANQDYEPHHRV